MTTELAAFVTDHFTDGTLSVRPPPLNCAPHACALAGWALQALALSRRLADATNQRFSVHVFSPCVGGLKSLPPPPPTSRTSLSLHSAHDAELTRLVKALGARELVNLKATLLKWEIFSLTAARVAVFVDLDLELLPHVAFLGGGAGDHALGTAAAAAAGLVAPSPRAARSLGAATAATARREVESTVYDWRALIECAANGSKELLTYPDFSSPVNAAIMLAKPSAARYRDGLDVLRRAAGEAFDGDVGWEKVGRPRAVTPPADDAWRRRRGHLQMLERNDWRFIGADIDQGFFFYMMRVKVQSGGDIRLSPCITERQQAKGKQHAHYFHYGAVGGCKPWNCLDDLWRTVPKLKKDGELRGPKYDEIAFAIGWARRTFALLDRRMAKGGAPSTCAAEDGCAGERLCAAARSGLERFESALGRINVSGPPRQPKTTALNRVLQRATLPPLDGRPAPRLYEFALPRQIPLAADSARLRGPYRTVEEAAREWAGGGSGPPLTRAQAPPRRPLAKAHGKAHGRGQIRGLASAIG